MATFTYENKRVYYESYGEGTPLLFLNGIMMSTLSWQLIYPRFLPENRILLLDLLDQGQSDKMDKAYTLDLQVEVVKALMDHLKLDKINIMGISYGGEVAIKFAIAYPELVEKMVLAHTSYRTSPWLEDIGLGWKESEKDPLNYYLNTIPVIYSPTFYNKHHEVMKKRQDFLVKEVFSNESFMQAMHRLTTSSEKYNVKDQLDQIQAKTLIISALEDYLVPVSEQITLKEYIKDSELIYLPQTGHASMYERPELFVSLVYGFINSKNEELKVF